MRENFHYYDGKLTINLLVVVLSWVTPYRWEVDLLIVFGLVLVVALQELFLEWVDRR